MDDLTLAQLKQDGFVHEEKDSGTYSDVSGSFARVKTVKAFIVLVETDILSKGFSIPLIVLEQSFDKGDTWQLVSSCGGWSSGQEPILYYIDKKGNKITDKDDPDSFSRAIDKNDPGMVVSFKDDKRERIFKLSYELSQPIKVGVKFDIDVWQ